MTIPSQTRDRAGASSPGVASRDDGGATYAVASFAVQAAERGAGSGQADAVLTALVDTVSVAVAGTQTPAAGALLELLDFEPAPGECSIWGAGRRVGPSTAALINGTAAHALDWDDASPTMPMHPAAVLLPALVARAGQTPVTTDAFVAAYSVGSAVFRAVSEVLPLDVHYGRGWHNTSTTGRLAATAALATLAGLDVDTTRHALGAAASMASGSLANFGTMTKPLHAGLAARDAVMAVALAERGLTARPTQLEATGGFFALFGDTDDRTLAELPERLRHWERSWTDDWAIKRYPSCYGTHRAIDAVLDLDAELDPATISSVEVTVHRGGLKPLLPHLPTSGLEGKFSLPYTVARALRTGQVRLSDFTDEAVLDAAMGELVRSVVVREGDDPEQPGAVDPFTVLTVHTRDGASYTRRVDISRGDSRNPLTAVELEDKAIDAFASVGWRAEQTRRLVADVTAMWRAGDLHLLQDVLGGSAVPALTRIGGDES